MASNKNPLDAFNDTLKKALDHFQDASWLGKHSPLAQPYFLGRYLVNSTITKDKEAEKRGQVLQEVIQNAANALWQGPLPTTRQELEKAIEADRKQQGDKGNRYYFFLLELCYLRQYFASRTPPYQNSKKAIYLYLTISESGFFRHQSSAIAELGKQILKDLQPTFRLEAPSLSTRLIGRTAIQEAILFDLQGKRSVAISGMAGVGKTSLGTALFTTWPTDAIFWFTVRPGLTDDLHSLLFSLGHFLNQRRRSTLWLHLIASKDRHINVEQAIGFLREDLQAIQPILPLLCFDEVDLLKTTNNEPRQQAHIQLLEFLEGLRGLVPILLIGQRALIDTDTHYALQPLEATDTADFLQQAGITADEQQLQQLHRYTNGNPRLLELYVALAQSGAEPLSLLGLHKSPSVQPLFNRLWRHLTQSEQHLLSILSVFRNYAPSLLDRTVARDTVENLVERNLIKVDQEGGLILLHVIRELIYDALPPRERQQLHQQAALIRAELGEYTAATYHYRMGEAYAAAVLTWYSHQEQEIERGQAPVAYEIFRAMSTHSLPDEVQQMYKVIHNRLALLRGEAEAVLNGIEAFNWHPDKEITAAAYEQMGEAHKILGQSEDALNRYEAAIEVLTRLSAKIVQAHVQRGQIFLQDYDYQTTHYEVQLARFEVELLEGKVEAAIGNYKLARFHFDNALHLAQVTNTKERIVNARYWLAQVAGKQKEIEAAQEHMDFAMRYYETVGDRLQLEKARTELAGMYLNVKQFERVIELATPALAYFERIDHKWLISSTCNHLAEAYLEQGDLRKAERYAQRVLQAENARSYPYAHYTLGHVRWRQGDVNKAKVHFEDGISISQKHGDSFIEAYLQKSLGELHQKLQEIPQAQVCYDTATRLFKQLSAGGK